MSCWKMLIGREWFCWVKYCGGRSEPSEMGKWWLLIYVMRFTGHLTMFVSRFLWANYSLEIRSGWHMTYAVTLGIQQRFNLEINLQTINIPPSAIHLQWWGMEARRPGAKIIGGDKGTRRGEPEILLGFEETITGSNMEEWGKQADVYNTDDLFSTACTNHTQGKGKPGH